MTGAVVAGVNPRPTLSFDGYRRGGNLPPAHKNSQERRKNLENINITNPKTAVKSLDELAGLKYLNNIFMDYNKSITSVNKLASCPNLIQVNVYGTKVKDVSELEKQSILVKYNPT